MTITQYMPRWLRLKLRKATPQNVSSLSKKDRQVLPTLPKPRCFSSLFEGESGRALFRVLWRL
jgi:hypothetical protein